MKHKMEYFFYEYGIPIISGIIGAFIGMTIGHLLGIV